MCRRGDPKRGAHDLAKLPPFQFLERGGRGVKERGDQVVIVDSCYRRDTTFQDSIANTGGIIIIIVAVDNVRLEFFKQASKSSLDTGIFDLVASDVVNLIMKFFAGEGLGVERKKTRFMTLFTCSFHQFVGKGLSATYMAGNIIVHQNFHGKGFSVSGKVQHIWQKFKMSQEGECRSLETLLLCYKGLSLHCIPFLYLISYIL